MLLSVSETLSDLDYISQLLTGRQDAFEPLVRKYQGAVRAFCFQMLKDRALADDAAQDVFIKAYQGIKSFRADASFRTWLLRIARNHCLDCIRSTGAAGAHVQIADLETVGSVPAALAVSEDLAIPFESKDFLAAILGRLSPDYREILLLREAGGLSYEELTETLGCTMDAVKARLRRARQEVFKILRHIQQRDLVYKDRS